MAVQIPVIVDIDKAFQDAAKRVPQAIEPLKKQISRSALNMEAVVGTDKKGNTVIKKFGDLLKGSTYNAKELRDALGEVNAKIKTIQARGGFTPTEKGLKTAEKDLLALRAALEIKLDSGNFIEQANARIQGLATSARTAGASSRAAIDSVNTGLRTQGGLLGMLTRYVSAYTAVFAGIRLIKNIRNVTAEFEMQRVALGGIIQDSTRAGRLFAEIKAAAVQSPFEIKDLVRFTKQLSAYRIETDKLFDVTMRLADVSAGLGVDMQRLVLAYGQVRAASVLRGQEVRQFTEAGIPIINLLAEKFSQLRGEVVSTGEVFELISKRAVPFAMVEEVFEDMTNAGGIFYEMQLKQSETLKGQWMKLKDVISIAYDEMGRTAIVNNVMKGQISMLSYIIKHWEAIAQVVNVALWGYIAYKAALKNLIPFYSIQQKSIARQIMLEKQQQIEEIKLASIGKKLSQQDQKRIADLQKLNAADYKRIYSMKKMTTAQAMLTYRRNMDNKEIVKAITQTGLLTKAQMKSISQMSMFKLRMTLLGESLQTFGKSVSTAIASFWPIAAISAVISMVTSLIEAHRAQVEAVKKVEKSYKEQDLVIRNIENAYLRLKQAIDATAEAESRAAKEASSFGEKLGYAQKIVALLKKAGLTNEFDLSLLNSDNIDEFIEKWLGQLDAANDLTREWGRTVANVANAAEGVFHILGDNLSSDIKDVTSSFVALTSDKEYLADLKRMRAYVETLETKSKKTYDDLSWLLYEDAKLAISQKRRNESEYQYQMRIIKNYEKIRDFAQRQEQVLSGQAAYFKFMADKQRSFQVDMDEIEHEFDKTFGSLKDKDPITVKMAIDRVFAENTWEDWLKEAWIERINNKYKMGIEITPTITSPNVPQGMKSIIATEFPTLFTEQELENMNQITDIGDAISKKMEGAAKAIEAADKQANNLGKSEAELKKINDAQAIIQQELAKDETDRNHDAIRNAYETIDAITKQNEVYDEQIKKTKEAAQAEYDLAKAAKERLLNQNLSDMAADIKKAFPELLKDPLDKGAARFLISEEELQSVKDGVDAYDLWAKNMKAIADEREKMANAGVEEKTVREEQAKIDAERLEIQKQLDDIEEKIKKANYEEVRSKYNALRLAVDMAATDEERRKAEWELSRFVKETGFAESAALFVERQRLTTQLGIKNAALGAKQAIIDTFAAIDNADKFWTEFGKRYNFTLKTKGHGGSQEDPWILIFKNRLKFVKDFQKGVQDLERYLGTTAAFTKERGIMEGRGLSLGFNGKDDINVREMTGSREEVMKWYEDTIEKIKKKIAELGGSTWSGLGVQAILAKDTKSRILKAWQSLLADVFKEQTDYDLSQEKKNFEEAFKKIKEDLKQSKEIRSFYEDILGLTGDTDLATSLTLSVYGGDEDGIKGFAQSIQDELDATLEQLGKLKVGISGQMAEAFKKQDFKYILDNIEAFPPEVQKHLREIAQEVENFNKNTLKDMLKTLQKAKTYGEQRVEIARKNAERIAKINAMLIPEDTKKNMIRQSNDLAAKEVAKLQYEAFKDSPLYVQMFERLDKTSSRVLRAMKVNLQNLKDGWKNLDPSNLKELTKRMEEIDKQLAARNPFRSIVESLKEFYELGGIRGKITKEQDAMDTDAKYRKKQQELEEEIKAYENLKEQKDVTKESLAAQKDKVEQVRKEVDELKKAADLAAEQANNFEDLVETIGEAANKISDYVSEMDSLASSVKGLLSEVMSDDTASYVNEQIDNSMNILKGSMDFVSNLASVAVGDFTKIVPMLSGLIDAVASVFGMSNAAKARKATQIIEQQEKVVENLEKEYDRLNDAIDKAFGSEYVTNFIAQQKVLEDQIVAYNKMIDAERDKGKKADQDKIDGWLDDIEEAQDKLKDMDTQLAEHFSGTDLTSAARDFANSWIEAYKSFASTTTAMKDNFRDMIDNMVVESLGAAIMQKILDPVFSEIDKLAKEGGELSETDIATIADKATGTIDSINVAMTALMQRLAKAGVNVRDTAGLSGIAKDIAGASEESINGLAAGINTQNFYMSYVPTISADVAAIRAAIEGTGAEISTREVRTATLETFGDETFRGQMQRIDENIADMRSMLRSVVTPKSVNTNTHCVATK